jgi:hypothetical protein
MWVIDRTSLVIIGVVLGVIAVVGMALLLAPPHVDAARSPAAEPVIAQESTVTSTPQIDPAPPSAAEPVPSSSAGGMQPGPIVDGTIHTAEYAHAIEAGGFRVYWSNDANVLRVGLFCPVTGYLAIGIDPDRRMRGANFILGAVRNGQLVIRDDYGTGTLSHRADVDEGGTDDILAAAGQELNGQTTIEFIIPLDSGDPYDKPLIPGETYPVLIAFHDTSDSFATRHSQRGSGEIRLDDI